MSETLDYLFSECMLSGSASNKQGKLDIHRKYIKNLVKIIENVFLEKFSKIEYIIIVCGMNCIILEIKFMYRVEVILRALFINLF